MVCVQLVCQDFMLKYCTSVLARSNVKCYQSYLGVVRPISLQFISTEAESNCSCPHASQKKKKTEKKRRVLCGVAAREISVDAAAVLDGIFIFLDQ